MGDTKTTDLIELDTSESIWESFFTVFPLVVIGTREADGSDDLARNPASTEAEPA